MIVNMYAPTEHTIGVRAIISLRAVSEFKKKDYYELINLIYSDNKEKNSIGQFVEEAIATINKCRALVVSANDIRYKRCGNIDDDSHTNSLDCCTNKYYQTYHRIIIQKLK